MDPMQEILAALKARDEATARGILAKHPGVRNARVPGMDIPLLQMAIYARASKVVDALLAAGVEPTIHEAAALGMADRVRALAAKDRAEITSLSPDGAPPLHLAAHFGRSDVVALLLRLGAPVDAQANPPFGNMALHAAAAGAQDAVVEQLLRAGANPDARDHSGFTPLMVAAANGRADAVRALLAKGADARLAASDGKTALDLALARDEDEVAALLRDA